MQKVYDAYTHIFLASHYVKYWGEIFDPRWYLGFRISSYLPLYHESLAALSLLITLENAFRVTVLIVFIMLIYSLYSYYTIFFEASVSRLSILFTLSIPSLYLFFFLFGQIPQLLSISLCMLSISHVDRFIKNKDKTDFLASIISLSAALIVHTLTIPIYLLLFTCYFMFRVSYSMNIQVFIKLVVPMVISLVIVSPIIYLHVTSLHPQTPIPHGSRYPFANINNFLFFFLNIYGLQIVLFPLSLASLVFKRNLDMKEFCYVLFILFFFILGLGYTTPLPNILFSKWSSWITYDRFSLLASLLSPPVIAKYFSSGKTKHLYIILVLMLILSIASIEYSRSLIFCKEDIRVKIAADFLNEKGDDGYTYLTLGFGVPSLAKLGIYSDIYTIDGAYPTARGEFELLKDSGIETIDSAKLYPKGIKILNYILLHKKEYGIKYILSADDFYDTLLYRYGYKPIGIVDIGKKYIIWESENSVNRIDIRDDNPVSPYLSYYWFVIPLIILSLLVSIEIRYILFMVYIFE